MVHYQAVLYVVDRFVHAGLEREQILDLTRTMKDAFGVESEEEAEAATEKVLETLLLHSMRK